jgi:hypothetical protein
MYDTINSALGREGKFLCPSCDTINDIKNSECEECGNKLPKTSTPEDGL